MKYQSTVIVDAYRIVSVDRRYPARSLYCTLEDGTTLMAGTDMISAAGFTPEPDDFWIIHNGKNFLKQREKFMKWYTPVDVPVTVKPLKPSARDYVNGKKNGPTDSRVV